MRFCSAIWIRKDSNEAIFKFHAKGATVITVSRTCGAGTQQHYPQQQMCRVTYRNVDWLTDQPRPS